MCPSLCVQTHAHVYLCILMVYILYSDSKKSSCSVGDLGLISGSRRSPGEGNGNVLQILAWRIPSVGSQRIGHDWATSTFTFSLYLLNITSFLCMFPGDCHLLSLKARLHMFSMGFLLFIASNPISELRMKPWVCFQCAETPLGCVSNFLHLSRFYIKT